MANGSLDILDGKRFSPLLNISDKGGHRSRATLTESLLLGRILSAESMLIDKYVWVDFIPCVYMH